MMTVTLSDFDPHAYARDLSRCLMALHPLRQNNDLGARQDSLWGGGDAFEPVTGGVFLPDCEWFLCHHPYKTLFARKSGNALERACPLENGILLRGPSLYYFLVSHKPKGKPLPTALVCLWREYIRDFLGELRYLSSGVGGADDFHCAEDPAAAKLILGILDNLRHIVLHCLTANVLMGHTASYCISLEGKGDFAIAEQLLREILTAMEIMVFQGVLPSRDVLLNNLARQTGALMEQTFSTLLSAVLENDLAYYLKLHREADSFWENYTAMRYVSRALMQLRPGERLRFFCIMSGAVELGVLLARFLPGSQVFCVGIWGDYLFRHGGGKDIVSAIPVPQDPNSFLVDDNVLTGNTILRAGQLVRDAMGECPEKCILLRHPDVNRIPQMVACGRAVNVDFLREDCLGLLNPSPYSRIPLHSNLGGEYLDCFHVFTLTGEFFLRYLYKNGAFLPDSEVGYYGRNLPVPPEDEHGFLL